MGCHHRVMPLLGVAISGLIVGVVDMCRHVLGECHLKSHGGPQGRLRMPNMEMAGGNGKRRRGRRWPLSRDGSVKRFVPKDETGMQ